MGVNLGLAQAGQIVGDGFFVVQLQMLGVGADEAFVEHTAGELIEVLFLDSFEHARADLGDVGDVIEREAAPLALCPEFVAERTHCGTPAGGAGSAGSMTGSS